MPSFWKKKHISKEPWDLLFSQVSTEDISLAKKITYNCWEFRDSVQNSVLNSPMTNGQFVETIAFAKVFHFHLISRSPIVHNLFYAFLHELLLEYQGESLFETISIINNVKIAEKWYMESYLRGKENGFADVMDRYFHSINRLQSDESDAPVTASDEDFRQSVGPLLEILHHKYM